MAMSLDSSERHGTSDEYKEDGTSGRMSGAVDWDSKHGTSDDYIDPWCDPCENEGKYVRVTSYCPTCVEFFCKHCDRSHSKFQITKFHILKRGSDMPSCQAAKPPKYEECRKHDGKFKEYMCTDHRIMICLVCEKDHGKCSVKHATEISRFLGSADIDSFEHEVENLYKAATATKELVEINIDNIADQRKLMLKEAQTKYEEMISNCSQQLKDASDEINQKCEARVSALSQNHKDLLSGMMQINVILQQVKTADRSKMDVKSFIKLQALAENTRQQMSELHDMTGAFQRSKITFTLDKNWESFLSNSMTMGTVTQSLSAFEQVVPSWNIVFPAILAEVAPFRKLVVPNRCMESKIMYAAVELVTAKKSCGLSFTHELDVNQGHEPRIEWYLPNILDKSTSILIEPDGRTVIEFGDKAEYEYQYLLEDDESYFFRNVYKVLNDELKKDFSEDFMIVDETGKTLSATAILHLLLGFHADSCQRLLELKRTGLRKSDYHWVIITPSTWTKAAVDLVTAAAAKEGLVPSTIITEAEAASAYGRRLLSSREYSRCIADGSEYLIIDARDDSVVLTIDVKDKHNLPNTIYVASVDGVGFTHTVTDFLNNIFGDDVVQQFRRSWHYKWSELVTRVRNRMINHNPMAERVYIRIPIELSEIYVEHGGTLPILSRRPADSSRVVCNKADILRIDSSLFTRITSLLFQKIVTSLMSLLQDREEPMMKTILMFGDVSKSVILQNAVKCAFQKAEVIVSETNGELITGGLFLVKLSSH